MTTATFYKNGFVITGHTRNDICSELSMFAWTVTNIIMNISAGKYVTDEIPGYGHFIFDQEDPTSAHIFSVATRMLPVWAEKYGWNDFVNINVLNEILTLPDRDAD
ncbi:hypothetical protein K0T92_14390 [Paenibacillus oenotherae]|uniref:Uncharacterized protein n=1 Tax=Paenibacillus oenotherae TaxID=1435645 RepID=A0ABS7D7W5_9BACL|nr:hypothetical protein [Paenibacillus oenotherae]MBW7475931.1 hypothetical protein [Paenibacillus oenotherae]